MTGSGGQQRHRRKRRTREHVIADLSANHVERFVLRAGHTVERSVYGYGIDLRMTTYNASGEVEGGMVLMQLKVIDSLAILKGQQSIAYRLKVADVRRWLEEPDPVILVVYDAQSDVAYWLYVQAHFEQLPSFDLARAGTTVTVRIPRENILDEAAIKTFATFRDNVLNQRKGVVHHHG